MRVIVDDLVLLQIDIQAKTRYVPPHSVMVNFDTAVLLRVLQLCAPLMFRVDFTIETATNKAAEIMKTMCMRDVNAKLNLHTLSEAAGTCEEDEEDDAESEDSAAPAKKPKRSLNIDDHIESNVLVPAAVPEPIPGLVLEPDLCKLLHAMCSASPARLRDTTFALSLVDVPPLLTLQDDVLTLLRHAMHMDKDKIAKLIVHLTR